MAVRWYVAGTLGAVYTGVTEHLRRAGFAGARQIMVTETRLERGRVCQRKLRMFPGYVMVPFDVELDPWARVNRCVGVNRLLPIGEGEPRPLPVGFMESLIDAEERGVLCRERADAVVYKFTRDERVLIGSGAWLGHEGSFQYYRKGSLVVLLSLFGRQMPISFRPDEVVPALAAA